MAFSRVAAPCRARTVVPCCSSRVAVVTGPKPSIGKLASSRAAHAHVRDTICTAASGAVGTAAQDEPVGASYWQGVFSVLNILMGVGLLSIPLALAKSGWAGLLVLWLLGIVTNYTGKALVRCYNTVEKTTGAEQVKYEDIAGTAFGAWGKRIISVIMYTELVGICALLLILQGDNLWNLFGTALASSPTHCMMIATLFIVPTVWAPDVKSLSVLGMAGFTATFTVCAVLAYTLLTGDFTPGASTAVVDWSNLPLIFGIMAFVYAGHSVFPAIQASMQQPQLFPSVLNTAYILVGSLCTFLGISGYYMYGNGALDVITFNLKSGLAKTVCACLVLVNPLAKFALTMEPVAIGVREKLAKTLRVDTSYLFRVMVNTLLVGCILLIARFLPYLALVMSLIGSFMTITISVIFPAAANYKLHSADMSTAEKLWCFAVVAIGIACAISGTTSAILALQAKM